MNARELHDLMKDLPHGVLPDWFESGVADDGFAWVSIHDTPVDCDAATMIVAEACSDDITRSGYTMFIDPIGDGNYWVKVFDSRGSTVFDSRGDRLSLLVAACKAVG